MKRTPRVKKNKKKKTRRLERFPIPKRRRTVFIPMGDGNDLVAGHTYEEEPKPVVIAWLENPAAQNDHGKGQEVYEQLSQQIFDPDPERSKVITLHLYVEYWLNKLLDLRSLPKSDRFWKNTKTLNEAGIVTGALHENILIINRLRNIYAHSLELEAAHAKVGGLLEKIVLDPHFMCSDKDHFRLVCLQTMFSLEAIYNNGGLPPKYSFPTEETRARLKKDGKLHWQDCELLKKEQKSAYVWQLTIRCPNCTKGTIIREKDDTPGYRDSWMGNCDICGLTGDGSYFILETAQKSDPIR